MLAVTVGAAGCEKAAYVPAPRKPSSMRLLPQSPALEMLRSERGPSRFARVREGLYRGGQPTREHLQRLAELGVKTVISLRREDRDARRAEEQAAREVGLRFLHFPFYGIFGADRGFLERVLHEMRSGGVYIHCKHGRDRTSLLVALSRVLHEGWAPADAWQEVLDFGYQPTTFYRALRSTFWEMVSGHPAPVSTAMN